MNIKFHWRLVQGNEIDELAVDTQRVASGAELPRIKEMGQFCRLAERAGIDSLLVDINYGKPDPMTMALALARETRRIKLIVAHRPGLESPTLFAQRVNTFTALAGDRMAINLVAGHSPDELRYFGDHLPHDERYERMDEFLHVCDAYWRRQATVNFKGRYFRIEGGCLEPLFGGHPIRPCLFLGGGSKSARKIASRWADVWMRFPDEPDRLAQQTTPIRRKGLAVGLRMAVIARDSRAEALEYGCHIIENEERRRAKSHAEKHFVRESDSHSINLAYRTGAEQWLTPYIWLGPVRTWGAPTMTLLGSYQEVSEGIMEMKAAGITHYILSGWPKQDEMVRFGDHVIPRVRELEARAKTSQTFT